MWQFVGAGVMTVVVLLGAPVRADDPFWAMWRPDLYAFEPTIGVGPQCIIQVGNFRLTVYDRDPLGTEQWRARLNKELEDPAFSPNYFWKYPNGDDLPGAGGGDVRVLYDQFASRFIVMSMRISETEPYDKALYLAVSKDDNPQGHDHTYWDKFYIYIAPPGTVFHYPGLAVNEGGIYVSSAVGAAHGVQILRRPPPPPWQYDPGYYELPGKHQSVTIPAPDPDPQPGMSNKDTDRLPMPAHFLGTMSPDTMYLVQLTAYSATDPPVPEGHAQIRIIALDPSQDPVVPKHHDITLDVPGSVWHFWQLCPEAWVQWHWNIQNVVWSAGRLYFARFHGKDDGYPGISPQRWVSHWYVVDTRNWPHIPGQVPVIEREGIVDGGRVFIDDDPLHDRPVHCIYPLVMPTESGDLAVFFSRYHAYGYMDLCWTACRSTDPPGWMTAPVTVMTVGTAGVGWAPRWGDYEGIALDPLDANRVWGTAETGRCTPQTPCTPCDPLHPELGQYQSYWHTAIGSYTVPETALRTLTIRYATPQPPAPEVHIKVTPPDATGAADALLTPQVPSELRWYAQGTFVTLRAPLTAGNYAFIRWEIGQTASGGSPAGLARQIRIQVNSDATATAVYQ